MDETYFPAPDSEGGWRTPRDREDVRTTTGIDAGTLDAAFAFIQRSTRNGGLLVLRHGWLVYERYFGKGDREATPNSGSCGKSTTSIAMGMLMEDRPELFPDGLDQKVFTPDYLPAEAFPLSDPRKQEIRMGELLSFTAGIRGNNPSWVDGKQVTLDPIGPDGWEAMVDATALGMQDGVYGDGTRYSAVDLWCEPGGGYSYATACIHLVSIMVRHVTGMELARYVGDRLAGPLGWGRWGYGYRHAKQVTHTPGGGGIALRATDMLRFGYLLLRQGQWAGEQLVPAEYVRHCAGPSPYNPHYPYSLQFTVNAENHAPGAPRDAYWKAGSGGHAIYVVPSLGLVVWKMGGRDHQYSEDNTGLPEVETSHPSREGWEASVDDGSALRQTLGMVVEAIRP